MAQNRRANSVIFGFDFQVNAAIVLMLENIKNLETLKLEGDYEDIELKLKNNKYVLAQAKAVEQSSKDFKNVRKNELIMANYELLRSILMNFSDNALYSSNEKSEVEIKISNIGEKVRISVRDYGEELPLSIWRSVKKQNHQPVRANSRPQSSGLGIFIAQSFAAAMGAKIGVIRHRNGSTFYVDLNRSGQLSLL